MAVDVILNLDDLDNFMQNKEETALRVLKLFGEKAITEARHAGSYQDQTANLRNSTGYQISRGGKVEEENFSDGLAGGKAKNVAQNTSAGVNEMSLTVVAGMEYASAVESKGYNVLTSAEQLVERELPKFLRSI